MLRGLLLLDHQKAKEEGVILLLYKLTNIQDGKPKCITLLQNTHNEKKTNSSNKEDTVPIKVLILNNP